MGGRGEDREEERREKRANLLWFCLVWCCVRRRGMFLICFPMRSKRQQKATDLFLDTREGRTALCSRRPRSVALEERAGWKHSGLIGRLFVLACISAAGQLVLICILGPLALYPKRMPIFASRPEAHQQSINPSSIGGPVLHHGTETPPTQGERNFQPHDQEPGPPAHLAQPG